MRFLFACIVLACASAHAAGLSHNQHHVVIGDSRELTDAALSVVKNCVPTEPGRMTWHVEESAETRIKIWPDSTPQRAYHYLWIQCPRAKLEETLWEAMRELEGR